MIVVADTSPLVILVTIGQIDLLRSISEIIPPWGSTRNMRLAPREYTGGVRATMMSFVTE